MQLPITKTAGAYLVTLRKLGPNDVRTICTAMDVNYEAAGSALHWLKTKHKLVEVIGKRGVGPGRYANIFDLCPELKKLSLQELSDMVEQLPLPNNYTDKPKPMPKSIQVVAESKEKTDFIAVNAPYLTKTEIATALGVRPKTVQVVAQMLGIELTDEARDPRACDIAETLSFIPAGTKITQWEGGTSFHLPSNLPGITRVTRHFAAE